MSNVIQYCFEINNPKNITFDKKELTNFFQKLYIGREPKFNNIDELPFVVSIITDENIVCIRMLRRGKALLERMNDIHDSFSPRDLIFKKYNMSFGKPYLRTALVEQVPWWEGQEIVVGKKKGSKWNTLQHNGPYFTHIMEPYECLGGIITYEGKEYPLDCAQEEQVAMFYARKLLSDITREQEGKKFEAHTKDPVFNNNFFTDFKTYLTPKHRAIFKDFNKIEWDDLIALVEATSAGNLTQKEKNAKKQLNEQKKTDYGYAYINGSKEALRGFATEPASIFMGRGNHPLRGRIKKNIQPEDVIVNYGGPGTKPPQPPIGHNWKQVVSNPDVQWVASYKDTITGGTKNIYFDDSGQFKGKSDLFKYEKARKLEQYIEKVRDRYRVDAISSNPIKKQLGTVLWLIDNEGIRPGGERDEDEADTLGASTLTVDTVSFPAENVIKLSFLGKDSIPYEKEMQVPEYIFKNMQDLVRNKSPDSQLFDRITAQSINAYLKEDDKDFSSKVFRTRLASEIMYNALANLVIDPDADSKRIKALFSEANADIAKILNHKKLTGTISKTLTKFRDSLVEQQKELKKLRAEKPRNQKAIDRTTEKIRKLQDGITAQENVAEVSIQTSLKNYIDPRIIIAWAKNQPESDTESDKERWQQILASIYTPILLNSFNWAVQMADENWDWIASDLMMNPELDPAEVKGIGVAESSDKPRPKAQQQSRPKAPAPSVRPTFKPVPRPDKPAQIENIGTIRDYKILYDVCTYPKKVHEIAQVSIPALKWIAPFAQHAVDNKINPEINRKIVAFYKARTKQP